MQPPPSVFLIDDQDDFSDSLVKLIASMGLRVVRFASGGNFLRDVDAHQSGCVVIDLGKPHLDGMRVLDELARRPVPPPAIVLTANADVSSVVLAARHGAIAFLQKQQAGRTEILDAIQAALKQDAQHRVASVRSEEIRERFTALTPEERQVLDLLLRGGELLAIAHELKVSRRTVENRRAQLMKKLVVTTFPALVALAAEYAALPPAS